jgi:hypothetical protein
MRLVVGALLLALSVAGEDGVASPVPSRAMKRVLLPQQTPPGNALGPACLDGSPPGFYWRPQLHRDHDDDDEGLHTPAEDRRSSKFLVFVSGGAWCWTPEGCETRLGTKYGGSGFWPLEQQVPGIMSGWYYGVYDLSLCPCCPAKLSPGRHWRPAAACNFESKALQNSEAPKPAAVPVPPRLTQVPLFHRLRLVLTGKVLLSVRQA